ncbi:DUF4880 domain-containing protein [Lampropedia puyangensis]|uniref:DUF4880 domain-containing protein n=1 Tax=Lampropedia puyangensis TaxID=1330072 RepID=A0A4S8FCN8_9BURK|nr:FecR domain-containing protein [Lampropedia puyangensis]THU05079.1 DUF4880 domain-containing protein [Lampropedia puyangensis]
MASDTTIEQQSAPAPHSCVEQAAWWLTQQQSGEAWTAAQQTAFDQWLQSKTEHAHAYARMQQLWVGFDNANTPAARTALQAGLHAADHRRQTLQRSKRALGGTTAAALLSVLTWWTWHTEAAQYRLADYRSGIGQITTVELPDHSQITLGSNSAFNVRFDTNQRRIELVRGDVLVHVAPTLTNAGATTTRPFIVQTPNATAQAMGTIYAVRYRAQSDSALWPAQGASTQVSVLESTVKACLPHVSSPTNPAPCAVVQAGQSTHIDAQGVHPVLHTATPDAASTPAWARGQLLADNLSLVQVLHELERNRPGYLWFDEKSLAGIRVSGVFDLIDTERSLRALQESTDVYVQHSTPWTTQVMRRQP